jgi:hypothetical protein
VATGAIDLRGADLLDRRWHLKLDLILRQVEREAVAESAALRVVQNAGAMAGAGQEPRAEHWKRAGKQVERALTVRLPYMEAEFDSSQIAARLADSYSAAFGDPKDPAYAAEAARTAAMMLATYRYTKLQQDAGGG